MGNGYSYAIAHIETEFVAVQNLDSKDEPARRNITYQELKNVTLGDDLRVNLDHVAIIYTMDANRDGVFSYDDLVAFAMWCSVSLPKDVSPGEFSDAVQARCVLRLWSDCMERGDNHFVEWLCNFLQREHPCEGPSTPFLKNRPGSSGRIKRSSSVQSGGNSSVHSSTLAYHPPPAPFSLSSGSPMSNQQGGGMDEPKRMSLTAATNEGSGTYDPQNPTDGPQSVSPNNRSRGSVGSHMGSSQTQQFPDGLRAAVESFDVPSTSDEELGTSDDDEELLRMIPKSDGSNKPLEWFNLDALGTLYTLLNVKEGYGLDFHTFCHVLSGEPGGSDALGTSRDISGEVGSAGRANAAHHSFTWSRSRDAAVSGGFGNTTQEGEDLYAAGASVRTFLKAFIESYWGILQRLGLEVLLDNGDRDKRENSSPLGTQRGRKM